jgi:hypothetical protein
METARSSQKSVPTINTVACRSRCYAATVRWADIPAPFLGNGSVNTFLQPKTQTQQYKSCVFYVARVEML